MRLEDFLSLTYRARANLRGKIYCHLANTTDKRHSVGGSLRYPNAVLIGSVTNWRFISD